MKALVLGATGFIGGHIAKAALEEGWTVRGLRRDPSSVGHLQALPIDWVNGNLNRTETLVSAMQGCDYVFHAAAFYPKDGNPKKIPEQLRAAKTEINCVLNAFNLSQAKRLIYTSSLTTIGHPQNGGKRLADERDYYQLGSLSKSGYYECKSLMESTVLAAANEGLDAVVLNPTAVFGPGDVHLTLGPMLIAVAKGQGVFWLPGEINVVDVRDVAAGHVSAAQKGKCGHRYILGGHNYTIKQALEIAAKTADAKLPRFQIPLLLIDLLVALGDVLPKLPLPANHMRAVRLWQGYNTQKAKAEIGFYARPFEDTVEDALSWFKTQGMLQED
jgi:dihydroflavonol-4-reductase